MTNITNAPSAAFGFFSYSGSLYGSGKKGYKVQVEVGT